MRPFYDHFIPAIPFCAFGISVHRLPVMLFADDDVKIFPESGQVPPRKDPAAEDAELFVRQRQNGNIDRAKRLGARYARHLRRLWRPGDTAPVLAQKKILYSYAVAKTIEERSPNSFLEQAALSAYHQNVQNRSKADYDTIVDSVAFTLYLLAERNRNDKSFGEVYAELCGHKHHEEYMGRGILLYHQYTADCASVFNRAGYR